MTTRSLFDMETVVCDSYIQAHILIDLIEERDSVVNFEEKIGFIASDLLERLGSIKEKYYAAFDEVKALSKNEVA